jgi:NAD/FAD-utilizing enzyme apparently involved in cell division
MFTSRAEYRLLLREDNADIRLTEKGRELGLVDDERWQAFCEKREAIALETQRMKSTWIQAGSAEAEQLAPKLTSPLNREYSLMDLLKRPELTYSDLGSLKGSPAEDNQVSEQVEISAKYAGYIDRQQEDITRLRQNENTLIPEGFEYSTVEGLSNELKQKLSEARPETIARASRIPGITPAAVSLLLIYLKKRGLLKKRPATA